MTFKIEGDENSVLSVSLSNILNLINDPGKIYWKILWLEAVGNLEGEKSMLVFEQQINKSNDGYLIEWAELASLSNKFSQVIEILLIGDKDKRNLYRYKNDSDMHQNCCYVFELVDSSYWEINTKEEYFTRLAESHLPGFHMPN